MSENPIPTPAEALSAAVKIVGSQSALGRILGVSQRAVWRWVREGKDLPPQHVLAVEKATGILKEHLRPDIYRGEQAAPALEGTALEPAR